MEINNEIDNEIHIGSWVSLRLSSSSPSSSNIPIIGTVKFIGKTDFAEGSWLGLLLIDECRKYAKNNGIVKGKRYFNDDTNSDTSSNFGLFVRPQSVKIISAHDLLLLSNISLTTKINLLYSNIQSLNLNLIDYLEKLETSQVENNYLQSENLSLKQQLNDLIINNKTLQSSLNIDIKDTDNNLSLKNKKLEILIDHLKEEFHIKECEYLELIDTLKKDFQNLEIKLLNKNSNIINSNILSDLNSSELIIEKLTSENSDLLIKIDNLNIKILELEKLIKLNNDLNLFYEQSEKELNEIINNLKQNLKEKNNELLIYKQNLNNANKIISSYELNNQFSYKFNDLIKKILISIDSSFIEYSNFISNKILPVEYNQILKFIKSLYKLKYFTNSILEFCNFNYSTEFKNWNLLKLKLDFILQLLIYNPNTFLDFQSNIDSIISFIMQCLESNNENDFEILLSMSLNLPLDINSFLKNENNLFELSLIYREIMIFYTSIDNSEIYNNLIDLRIKNKGIQLENNDLLLEQCIENNELFKNLNYIDVDLINSPFWKYLKKDNEGEKEKEQIESKKNINSDLFNELELKIKILQSKLQDEKKIQQELLQLEKNVKNYENNENDLKLQLNKAKENEINLNSRIKNLQNILNKYGIKDNFQLNDEFNILEKSKLLNTIEKQRSLISKLTEISGEKNEKFQNYSLELNSNSNSFSSPKFISSISPSYYRRIDNLFDNISNNPISVSKHNHNYNYQKILEYLDSY